MLNFARCMINNTIFVHCSIYIHVYVYAISFIIQNLSLPRNTLHYAKTYIPTAGPLIEVPTIILTLMLLQMHDSTPRAVQVVTYCSAVRNC